MTAIVDPDPAGARALGAALGVGTLCLTSLEALREHLRAHPGEDAVVLGPGVDTRAALDLAVSMRVARPALGVVLVRQRLETSVLTEAMRAGVREVVEERDLVGLTAAVRRAHELARALREKASPGLASADGHPHGQVITVFSAKGGCGKTTLATNLAAALADRGRRQVVLVDLDLAFGDVAIALQLFPVRTIADAVALTDALDVAALKLLLTSHSPGLSALVAPLEPSSAEAIPVSLVTRVLELLREEFDFVVVDTPPAFDDHVLAAFDLSDLVPLIATLEIPALKNLKITLETMDLLNFPRERIRIVLNRADSKVGLAVSEVEATLKGKISIQIPSSRDVPASINRGVPIVLDDPGHPVSQAIRQLADLAAAERSTLHGEARGERRGLLRRRSRTS